MDISKFVNFKKLWKYIKQVYKSIDYKMEYEIKHRDKILKDTSRCWLIKSKCCLLNLDYEYFRCILTFGNIFGKEYKYNIVIENGEISIRRME